MDSTARATLMKKRQRLLRTLPRTRRNSNAVSPIFSGTIVALNAVVCFFTTPVGSAGTPCGGDLTGNYGVVASPNYPSTYPLNVECLWYIHANTSSVNVTGVELDLKVFNTLECDLGNDRETLMVYTSDPNVSSSTPYDRFCGKPSKQHLSITTSNEIWLWFRSRTSDGSGQGPPTSETLRFLIVYLQIGADVRCDGDPLPYGSIKTGNGSASVLVLESQVVFQCDWGFRMEGVSTGECMLIGDGSGSLSVGPRWSHVPKCVSTCEVPASVTNGSFVKSSPTLTVNSTVTYFCNDPYVLNNPDPAITCVLDNEGTPHWNRVVPSCLIPDCSRAVPLTAAAGALVNPSFPSLSVLGGLKYCRWTITVQVDMAVNVNVSYFDVPPGAQLSFRDGATQRVLKIFHGGQRPSPDQMNFNSSGASVDVVYNGPVDASNQSIGFYISYRTVERSVPVIPTVPSTTSGPSTTAPIKTSTPVSVSSTSDNPQERHTGDDSGSSAGKIAAGVVVTVVILVVAGVIGFCWYRKKYPVRMTVGRTFAKFTNPQYNTPHRAHTLIREDASDYFRNQLQMQPESMHSQVSIILGGDEEHRVQYVNTAFEYDSHDVDEEEVERRFREKKAYLFKKDDEDKTDGEKKSGTSDEKTDGAKSGKSKKKGKAGLDQGHENEAYVDSDDENGDKRRSGNGSDSSSTSSEAPGSLKKKAQSDNNVKDSERNNDTKDDRAEDGTETTADETDGNRPDIPSNFGSSPDRRDSAMAIVQGMTVKEFLMRTKEQRAMSDVTRERSGSLPVVDYTKSARRRAQSMGDVFASDASRLSGAPKISPSAVAVESSIASAEIPEHSELGKLRVPRGSVEKLTDLPGESSLHEESDEVKTPDDSESENERNDKTVETIPSLPTEREPQGRPDGLSTASDSDEEGSMPSDTSSSSSGVLVPSPGASPGPTHEDQSNSYPAASNPPESSPSTDGGFHFVNKVQQEHRSGASSPSITDEVSADGAENTAEAGKDFHKVLTTESSQVGHVGDSLPDVSPSSSFVIVPPSGAEEINLKTDELMSRTSTDTSLGSDEIFVDSDDDDTAESHPKSEKEVGTKAGTPPHLLEGSSQQLPSGETPAKKKTISVVGLTSIAYSDNSSSNESEAESDKGEYNFERDENNESHSQPLRINTTRSAKPIASESSDEEDSTKQHSDFTFIGASAAVQQPFHPGLPTEGPQPLEFSLSGGGSPDPRRPGPEIHPQEIQFIEGQVGVLPHEETTRPRTPSPQQQRLRGLAALRIHPASRPSAGSTHSDSDGDMEFTTEDVEIALRDGGSDSSDEDLDLGSPPPLPQSAAPSKVTLKLDPADTFVFDEEENEDIDV